MTRLVKQTSSGKCPPGYVIGKRPKFCKKSSRKSPRKSPRKSSRKSPRKLKKLTTRVKKTNKMKLITKYLDENNINVNVIDDDNINFQIENDKYSFSVEIAHNAGMYKVNAMYHIDLYIGPFEFYSESSEWSTDSATKVVDALKDLVESEYLI